MQIRGPVSMIIDTQGFKNRIEAFRIAKLAEANDATPPFFCVSACNFDPLDGGIGVQN